MIFAADTYTSEKLLALIPTAVAVLIAAGFLVPVGARRRAQSLQRKLGQLPPPTAAPDPNATQRAKLQARSQIAQQQQAQSYFAVLLGADRRLSTSKTIAAAWTVVVAYILFALVLVWPSDWDKALANLTPTYALLLGGPFASLVLAKAAISYRVAGQSIQKTQGNGDVRLSDLMGDDSGQPDLFDGQYVIFNIIAIAFVIDAFIRATLDGFPSIPVGLALLTGGPAAVYLANKTVTSNTAAILSVVPSRARVGDPITINGQNFTPSATAAVTAANDATAPAPAPIVEVGGVQVPSGEIGVATDTVISARIPDLGQLPTTPLGVGVVTSSGQRAYLASALTILTAPALLGLDAAQAAPGDHITATGRWSLTDDEVPIVLVDGLTATVAGQPHHGTSVTFIVPQISAVLPAHVAVTVVINNEASEPRTLLVTFPKT